MILSLLFTISTLKKIHVLVIPKKNCVNLDDFNQKASEKEIVELSKAISHVCEISRVSNQGYRTLANIGSDGGQEVPHLHFHIFGGKK